MTLESLLLSSVPGIRHAFFTRAGGVSSGIYAGLNGGNISGEFFSVAGNSKCDLSICFHHVRIFFRHGERYFYRIGAYQIGYHYIGGQETTFGNVAQTNLSGKRGFDAGFSDLGLN